MLISVIYLLRDRISLWNTPWTRIWYVEEAGLKSTDLPASASYESPGIKCMPNTLDWIWFFSTKLNWKSWELINKFYKSAMKYIPWERLLENYADILKYNVFPMLQRRTSISTNNEVFNNDYESHEMAQMVRALSAKIDSLRLSLKPRIHMVKRDNQIL